MEKLLWTVTVIGAVLGAAIVIFGEIAAKSAPQEAASSGLGIAISVIPYCLARAYSELQRPKS